MPGDDKFNDTVARLLTEKIENGNLFVFDPNDSSPVLKAVKGPKVSDKKGRGLRGVFMYKANLAFENIETDIKKIAKPKMPVFKYLLSFLGFYKKDIANYNESMTEYKTQKELIKNVLNMEEERKAQMEIEQNDPELIKRREIVKEANTILDRFKHETKDMEINRQFDTLSKEVDDLKKSISNDKKLL